MEEIEQAITNEMWKQSCLYWATKNDIRTEKGFKLEFGNHRFLKDIYDDMTSIQVVRKSSQIGFSTMMILKSFWLAKFRNYNIIYTLPTFGDVGQFVPSKVNAIIDNNPLLHAWTKDKDTVLQKKIGNGFIYYRGTFSSSRDKMESAVGTMFSSDVNLHDESDRSDQTILEQYASRLEASPFAGRWFFSNPTSPHTASQVLFEKSDQKHWFVKCGHCGLWQYLDFWKNIKDNKYVCQKCEKEISNEARKNGQWVRKYTNRDISGYWISHLMCPWISAEKIAEEERTKTKQYFYNFVLGLPYIGSDIVVNQDIILKCIDLTKPNFQQNNVMGVDTGIEKYYVILNSEGIFKIGKTEKWEDIEEMIKTYDVEICVIDAMPDITAPRKLKEKYPGKVWLNYFRKEIKKAEFIFWDNKTHTVYSDRTKIIQQAIDKFVNREIRIQLKPDDLTDYIKHWQSLYRITEKDSMGIEKDSWESIGDDHFTFATIYAIIGLERTEKGGTEIKSWSDRKEIYNGLAPDIQEILKRENQFL